MRSFIYTCNYNKAEAALKKGKYLDYISFMSPANLIDDEALQEKLSRFCCSRLSCRFQNFLQQGHPAKNVQETAWNGVVLFLHGILAVPLKETMCYLLCAMRAFRFF